MFGTLTARESLTGDGDEARRVSRRCNARCWRSRVPAILTTRTLPRWEPYTLPRRATMVFDVESRLADDPRGAERQLFAKVPFIQQGT